MSARVYQFPIPLTRRVMGTVFEEPYSDECGRRLFTAVSSTGVRIETRGADWEDADAVVAALHELIRREWLTGG